MADERLFPVNPLSQVVIEAAIAAQGTLPDKNPALIRLRFFSDARLSNDPGDIQGLSRSETVGHYAYIGARGAKGPIEFRKVITVPAGIDQVGATIVAWHAPTISIARDITIAPFAGDADDILWEQTLPVPELADLCITATLSILDGHSARAPALIAFTFHDGDGKPITQLPDSIGVSRKYGPYLYLGRPGDEGRHDYTLMVPPPHGAAQVTLRMFRLGAGTLSLNQAPKVSFRHLEQAGEPRNVLADIDIMVRAGETWDVSYRHSGSGHLADGFALLRYAFLDERGWTVPICEGDALVTRAGAYRSFARSPVDEGSGRVTLVVPQDAVRLRAKVIGWRLPEDRGDVAIETICLGDGGPCTLHGAFEGPDIGGIQAFSARFAAGGAPCRSPGLIEWLFEDEYGEVLEGPAKGLNHTSRYPNCSPLLCFGDGGVIHVRGLLEPPPGTRRILWRLRPHGGASVTTLADMALARAPSTLEGVVCALPACARHTRGLEPDRAPLLRAAIVPDAFDESVLGGTLDLLAEAVTSCEPGAWLELRGLVTGGSSGLPPQVVVRPLFFDAAGHCITGADLAGCRMRKAMGTVRCAAIALRGSPGANLREAFLVPEHAAYAVFHVGLATPQADLDLRDISIAPITPDTVLAGLDTTIMRPAELLDAADVADAAGHLAARHALAIAQASLAPKDPKLAQLAKALAHQRTAREAAWLPPLPGRSSGPADPLSVLLLAAGESETAASLAACGLHPVVYVALGAPCPSGLEAARDGMTVVEQNGIVTCHPHYPGLQRAKLAETDRLSLDAILASRLIGEKRISLIHAAPGMDPALIRIAAALARAHALPLVCEIDSPGAAEDPLLQAADVVVARSGAVAETCTAKGLAADTLVLAPDLSADRLDEIHAAARRNHAKRTGRVS